MKMDIQNFILDVDGTLWNTTDIVADAWNRAIREDGNLNISVDGNTLKQVFGRTMRAIADLLFDGLEEEKKLRLLEKCCQYEQEALEENECNVLFSGVTETIKTLSEQYGIYIVSNCHTGYIELFLRKTGLAQYVSDFESYGSTGKGKADNISLLIERNHLSGCVYVGDTQGDCDACKKAGIPFVYASYGFGAPDHCQAEIKDFAELLYLDQIELV